MLCTHASSRAPRLLCAASAVIASFAAAALTAATVSMATTPGGANGGPITPLACSDHKHAPLPPNCPGHVGDELQQAWCLPCAPHVWPSALWFCSPAKVWLQQHVGQLALHLAPIPVGLGHYCSGLAQTPLALPGLPKSCWKMAMAASVAAHSLPCHRWQCQCVFPPC